MHIIIIALLYKVCPLKNVPCQTLGFVSRNQNTISKLFLTRSHNFIAVNLIHVCKPFSKKLTYDLQIIAGLLMYTSNGTKVTKH